jgi:RNase P/RNase MRP subunit POP5
MAGFKHRYLIVKLECKMSNGKKIDEGIITTFRTIIYNSIKSNFGEHALGMIDYFEVIERYETLGIVILRCNHAIYKYVCYTICSIGRVNETNVRFNILAVSGILRKAKKKMLEIEGYLELNKCTGS